MKIILLALTATVFFACKKKESDIPKAWKYHTFTQTQNLAIADTGFTESIITITGYDGVVTTDRLPKLTINNVQHYTTDIDLYLVSPTGATALLVKGDSAITSFGYSDTRFIDGKPSIYTNTHSTAAGEYSPHESFNVFVGSPVNGEWKLRVYDDYLFTFGEIKGWEIELYSAK